MSENDPLRRIWLGLGRISILFRLNSGRGWISATGKKAIPMGDGSVLIPDARPITLGLADPAGRSVKGPGDLTGYTSIQITPEMVGAYVAVYTNIECKLDADARKRPEQREFICQVKEAGGIAGFAHTPEMAIEIVRAYTPVRKSS